MLGIKTNKRLRKEIAKLNNEVKKSMSEQKRLNDTIKTLHEAMRKTMDLAAIEIKKYKI